MLHANFNTYNNYVTDSLYQWDVNQDLVISGLGLSVAPEIHFANADMDRAIVRQSTVEGGVVTVRIPNSLLQAALTIKAYVGVYEGDTFKVIETIEIPVIAKTKPADYVIEDSDEEIYSFKALENEIAKAKKEIGDLCEANLVELTATVAEANATLNARVDNIIAHNNDTEGNTELLDMRVDHEGNTHDSAGDAVRSQIGFLDSALLDKDDPCVLSKKSKFLVGRLDTTTGEFIETTTTDIRRVSDFVELETGVAYQFDYEGIYNEAVQTYPSQIIMYNADKTFSRKISLPAGMGNITLKNEEKYLRVQYSAHTLNVLRLYPKDRGYEVEFTLNPNLKVPQLDEALIRNNLANVGKSNYIHARRPIIAFIFDGEYDLNATVEELFYSNGFKVGFAPQYTTDFANNSIPTYLDWQNKGHEILAHGNYILNETTSYTDEQAEGFIADSYKRLKGYGFDIHGFIGSSGKVAERFLPTIKKYYDFAATENNHVGTGESNLYFGVDNPFKLWRYSVGSSTLDQLKAAIDRSIETNGLLMFITHADSNRSSENSIDKLTQIIEYLKPLVADYQVEVMAPYMAVSNYYKIRYDDIIT